MREREREQLIVCIIESEVDVICPIRNTGLLTVKSRSAHSLVMVQSRSVHSSPTLRSRSGKTFFAYIEIHLFATLPCLDSDIQLATDRL